MFATKFVEKTLFYVLYTLSRSVIVCEVIEEKGRNTP
jgi:hypothetical protein